ncbi:MAG: hypothetical protein ACFHWX_00885 [Bacteroidota bacterium]
MKRTLTWFFLLMLVGSSSLLHAQQPLEKVQINKAISLLVPKNFILMSKSDQINKYVSTKEPLVMYTSEDRNIDFGITLTNLGWATGDLDLLMQFYVSSIKNLYTEVAFSQQEVREINGRQFIVLEFVSKVTDESTVFGGNKSTSKYTYIQYTLFRNQVMLFNFSSPAYMRDRWQDAAKTMMESVKIDE